MATAKTLLVNVRADTRGFDNNLKRSRSRMKTFTNGLVGLGAAFASAQIIVGTFGRVISGLTSKITQQLDELGKWATRLETSATALAGLQFAAEQSGASADTMNRALARLQKNISDANLAVPLQTSARAFEALGLAAKDLVGLSIEQQFIAVAGGLQGLGDAAKRTQVIFDLFGRSGTELGVLLRETGGEIRNLTRDGRELTGQMEEYVQQAAEFNDAQNRLTTSWRGLTAAITTGTPFMTDWFNSLADGLVAVREFASTLESLRVVWLSFFDRDAAAQAALEIDFGTKQTSEQFYQLKDAIEETDDALSGGGFVGSMRAWQRAIEDANAEFQKLKAVGDRITRSVQTPFEKLSDELKLLEKLVAAGAITWETYFRAVAKANSEFGKATAPEAAPEERSGQFREVDLSRLDVGGLAAASTGEQLIADILRQNGQTLERIAENVLVPTPIQWDDN